MDVEHVETPSQSTLLEPNDPLGSSGGGTPRTLTEPAEPTSLRDAVTLSVKESDAEPADDEAKPEVEADEKAKPEAKPAKDAAKPVQPREGGKFVSTNPKAEEPAVKPEADSEPEDSSTEQKNGDRIHNAPARFLPDAKEVYANVPRAVKRDIETMTRDHEAQIAQARQTSERYEQLRQFDDLARSNGRDLRDSLAKVAEIEDTLQRNPLAGIQRLLIEAGPTKADGTKLSLYEVAQHIVNLGQEGYQRAMGENMQPPQQQARQPNPEVAQLRQEIDSLKQQQVTASVIEPFKQAHPRYAELEEDIVFWLQSGKIPASLSMQDRLSSAYDMAVRINPTSHVYDDSPPASLAAPRRVDDFDGQKSIKSAPGAVSPDMEPERGGSIRDLLLEETRRHSRSR